MPIQPSSDRVDTAIGAMLHRAAHVVLPLVRTATNRRATTPALPLLVFGDERSTTPPPARATLLAPYRQVDTDYNSEKGYCITGGEATGRDGTGREGGVARSPQLLLSTKRPAAQDDHECRVFAPLTVMPSVPVGVPCPHSPLPESNDGRTPHPRHTTNAVPARSRPLLRKLPTRKSG